MNKSLDRLLRREPQVRLIDEPDLIWLYATYKRGGAAEFDLEPGLSQEAFITQIKTRIAGNYDEGFVVESEVRGKKRPVGVVFVVKIRGLVFVGDTVWAIWASKRNRLEAMAAFFKTLGEEVSVTEYARPEDKRVFDRLDKHYQVIRRVGTKFGVYPKERAIEYETRRLA